MLKRDVRRFTFRCFFLLALPIVSLTSLSSGQAQAQSEPSPPPEEDLSDPNNLRPLAQADNLLSLQGGERLMEEANEAVEVEDYQLAEEKLLSARQVFNQLSNFHQQLAASFQGIDGRIADEQRRQALQSAQMRDEATYRLALVHRAKQEPELAVPLLIQVVRSQNPTTELGQKAYQQLFELGFVESPFPRSRSSQDTQPSAATNSVPES